MKPQSDQRKLRKHEAGIIGRWLHKNGEICADDNTLRIEWLIGNYLVKIGIDDGGWTTKYRDPEDGRYWQHSYPKGYMHGGGPPMLEHITPVTIAYKYIKETLTIPLRAKLYDVIDEQYHFGVFGGRYIVWSNHQRALRLTWDGKESQFVLEIAYTLPLSVDTIWNEIAQCPFNSQLSDPSELSAVVMKMVDAFEYN